jgi:hypothetical protein
MNMQAHQEARISTPPKRRVKFQRASSASGTHHSVEIVLDSNTAVYLLSNIRLGHAESGSFQHILDQLSL